MFKLRLVRFSAIVIGLLCAAAAHAEDISAKKLKIKDNTEVAKRQIQVQSADVGVQKSEADNPATNRAAIHVYSATDDQCIILPAGTEFWTDTGSQWKYKNKSTKTTVQIGDGKLKAKVKSDVTYSLADDGSQGAVNVRVQFGGGTSYCMRCSAPVKNDSSQYFAKDCSASACDPEPTPCDPVAVVLKGVLAKTTGRFNYNLVLGIPGSDAACNTNFPGTHTCTFAELQSAEAAGDLVGIKDVNNLTVTSFWAIDLSHAQTAQCWTTIPWDYQTAHTGHFAEVTTLNNLTGTLDPVSGGICANMDWVGCCL